MDDSIAIYSKDVDGKNVLHASGQLVCDKAPAFVESHVSGTQVDINEMYDSFTKSGLKYGSKFRLLRDVTVSEDKSICQCLISTEGQSEQSDGYLVYPAVMDALLQSSACCLSAMGNAQVPYAFDNVWLNPNMGKAASALTEHKYIGTVNIRERRVGMTIFDCSLRTLNGEVVVQVEGVCLRELKSVGSVDLGVLKLQSEWSSTITVPSNGADNRSSQSCLFVSNDSVLTHQLNQVFSVVDTVGVSNLSSSESLRTSYDAAVIYVNSDGFDDNCESSSLWISILERVCKQCSYVAIVVHSTTVDIGVNLSTGLSSLSCTISGCVLSAQLEYPSVRMKVINFVGFDSELLKAVEFEITSVGDDMEVLYVNGERRVRKYSALPILDSDISPLVFGFGSYVVTGGLGGLGLLSAKILSQLGAKRIVLVSRSGKVSYADQGLEDDVRWLQEESGSEVLIRTCDVSDEHSVSQLFMELRGLPGGIEGIVHSAGVVRDALIRGGGAAAGCSEVWSSKARSARILHEQTSKDNLRLFVSYSSIVAAIGNIGQSAYGSANRYIDGLMESRGSQGLAGVSIRWPAVRGVGMAAAAASLGRMSTEDGWSIGVNEAGDIIREVISKCLFFNGRVLNVFPGSRISAILDIVSEPCKNQFVDCFGLSSSRPKVARKPYHPDSLVFSVDIIDKILRESLASFLGQFAFSMDNDVSLSDVG
jgi:hypothetical protein